MMLTSSPHVPCQPTLALLVHLLPGMVPWQGHSNGLADPTIVGSMLTKGVPGRDISGKSCNQIILLMYQSGGPNNLFAGVGPKIVAMLLYLDWVLWHFNSYLNVGWDHEYWLYLVLVWMWTVCWSSYKITTEDLICQPWNYFFSRSSTTEAVLRIMNSCRMSLGFLRRTFVSEFCVETCIGTDNNIFYNVSFFVLEMRPGGRIVRTLYLLRSIRDRYFLLQYYVKWLNWDGKVYLNQIIFVNGLRFLFEQWLQHPINIH